MNSTMKQVLVWVLMIVGAVVIYAVLNRGTNNIKEISYLELMQKISSKEVLNAAIKSDEVTGELTSHIKFTSKLSGDAVSAKVADELVKNSIEVKFDRSSSTGLLANILITWAPILLIAAFWIFMLRQMQSGGNKA